MVVQGKGSPFSLPAVRGHHLIYQRQGFSQALFSAVLRSFAAIVFFW
jgi:hypothetical protein